MSAGEGLLLHDLRLIAYDADGALEACFQLGRLWRERTGEPYPVDMHDPSGPTPREMSEETGEDAVYWMLSDVLDGAGISDDRALLEIGRAARVLCLQLQTQDYEPRSGASWAEHAGQIRDALERIIPAETIAEVARSKEG
ncbi:MAG TPA: hypothetical protein VFM87_08680 [Agrococcus sp.]|nr:hypothetical protein [Agrococcus sp.]